MGSYKSLGPDGQTLVYQSQWEGVGDDPCNLVKFVFQDLVKVEEISRTLITLIPKVDNITKLRDFIPTSLCNVSYKVITKIVWLRDFAR